MRAGIGLCAVSRGMEAGCGVARRRLEARSGGKVCKVQRGGLGRLVWGKVAQHTAGGQQYRTGCFL